MYTLLHEYRKKRFKEHASVNPFVSPCPKTCHKTAALWTNLCHITQPSVCPSWKSSAFCGFVFSGCVFEDGWIGCGCMHLRLSEIGQGEVTLSKWAPFLFCGTAWCIVTKSKKHAASCTMEDDHSKDSSSYHQIGMSIQRNQNALRHYAASRRTCRLETLSLPLEHSTLPYPREHDEQFQQNCFRHHPELPKPSLHLAES